MVRNNRNSEGLHLNNKNTKETRNKYKALAPQIVKQDNMDKWNTNTDLHRVDFEDRRLRRLGNGRRRTLFLQFKFLFEYICTVIKKFKDIHNQKVSQNITRCILQLSNRKLNEVIEGTDWGRIRAIIRYLQTLENVCVCKIIL